MLHNYMLQLLTNEFMSPQKHNTQPMPRAHANVQRHRPPNNFLGEQGRQRGWEWKGTQEEGGRVGPTPAIFPAYAPVTPVSTLGLKAPL